MSDQADPMAELERQLKPYRKQFPSFPELPARGLARDEVIGLVERLAAAEEAPLAGRLRVRGRLPR